MTALLRHSAAGLRILLVLTVIMGLVYPVVVWAFGRLVPGRADGSLVSRGGEVVGSRLIGQDFTGDEWFQARPSAAGDGYDPLASGASNLGPESPELLAAVRQRQAEVSAREQVALEDVPPDAVTASGSGLDPHISPEYALLQVDRVAVARGLDQQIVRDLVESRVQGRQLGFLGGPRVNVLDLNVELDELGD